MVEVDVIISLAGTLRVASDAEIEYQSVSDEVSSGNDAVIGGSMPAIVNGVGS